MGARLVGEAACAREAIAGILRTRPRAVLLDLNLGGPTGLDVLRAIHARLPDTVFVVLSNHSEPQYRKACAAAGAAHFLDKSIDFACVPALLTRIAAGPH
jgi:DNA-binding NarL/FixJ family response regulator